MFVGYVLFDERSSFEKLVAILASEFSFVFLLYEWLREFDYLTMKVIETL